MIFHILLALSSVIVWIYFLIQRSYTVGFASLAAPYVERGMECGVLSGAKRTSGVMADKIVRD